MNFWSQILLFRSILDKTLQSSSLRERQQTTTSATSVAGQNATVCSSDKLFMLDTKLKEPN